MNEKREHHCAQNRNKRDCKKCCEQLQINKLVNLDEMEKFPGRHKLQKLT